MPYLLLHAPPPPPWRDAPLPPDPMHLLVLKKLIDDPQMQAGPNVTPTTATDDIVAASSLRPLYLPVVSSVSGLLSTMKTLGKAHEFHKTIRVYIF